MSKSGLAKNKKVFVALVLILILSATTMYFYNQYNKVLENNRVIKSHLQNDVLIHLLMEKNNIESLMTIVASDKPPTEKAVQHQAYVNLEIAIQSINTIKNTLGIESEEIGVLMSLDYTLSSLRSFLSQIDSYYRSDEQKPFELKNCASGRIVEEKDIHDELNKFLEILDYSDEKLGNWDDFIANWQVDNPYSCSY